MKTWNATIEEIMKENKRYSRRRELEQQTERNDINREKIEKSSNIDTLQRL